MVVSVGVLAQNSKSKGAVGSKEANLTDEINLSADDIADFKKQTAQKVEEFQQHISTLANKKEAAEKRNLAEREALKLFYKGAEMEISKVLSNGKVDIKRRPMEKYLARLKALPFTQVKIEFYDIAYITDFTRGPDGKYYSTATIFQKFTGYNGDKIVYTDITQKEIEIILDLVEDKFYNEKRWKIFLGDIKANETKSNKG